MLSVLAFKSSLFAGVLDGGADEVFMQGTRLSKFMESVEQVAGAMGEAESDAEMAAGAEPAESAEAADLAAALRATPTLPQDAADEQAAPVLPKITEPAGAESGPAAAGPAPAGPPALGTAAPPDPWATLLAVGAELLQGLATARSAGASAPMTIERDPVSGQASLRLPLPDAAVLQRLAKAFEPWLR